MWKGFDSCLQKPNETWNNLHYFKGYHSPGSFHKDGNRVSPAKRIGRRGKYRLLGWMMYSKLLNMRDFRPGSGFPLAAKTRYNSLVANGQELISTGMAFHAKEAPLARPGFVPTCC